ncbi:MAG: MarR family transcriptional regulator [Alphaproteobacteria bacterium]|nr:MarR family transcriptional regulator [Alphaproteobacteria bacterium]MCB9698219.1 MarR family transcriptional regulator [Alphaproteobacteria bacterium]
MSKLIMSMLTMSKLTISDTRPDLRRRRVQTRAMIDLARIRHASEALVESLLREHGLEDVTPAQANALMVLIDARRSLTAAELARELSLSEVTVGRFVRALEAGGWIAREPDPTDARALRLSATPKTRELLPRFIAVSNALLDQAFAGFDEERIAAFAEALATVRENLDSGHSGRFSASAARSRGP